MNDWGDWGLAFASAIIATLLVLLIVFIGAQVSNMDDCTKRGGSVVDTKGGWVCAKLEKV